MHHVALRAAQGVDEAAWSAEKHAELDWLAAKREEAFLASIIDGTLARADFTRAAQEAAEVYRKHHFNLRKARIAAGKRRAEACTRHLALPPGQCEGVKLFPSLSGGIEAREASVRLIEAAGAWCPPI